MHFSMRSIAISLNMFSIGLVGSFRYQPELALQLAEAFMRPSDLEGMTPARTRFLSPHEDLVNPRSYELSKVTRVYPPVQFDKRLDALVSDPRLTSLGFGDTIETIKNTCPWTDRQGTEVYKPSTDPFVALSQAAIVLSVLSQRVASCGYNHAYLREDMKTHLNRFIKYWTDLPPRLTAPGSEGACYIERAEQARARLYDLSDPLTRGFLTVDACHPKGGVDPSPIGISGSARLYPAEMIQIDYAEGGAAWMVNPPKVVNQASVWFNVLTAPADWSIIDLIRIQGKYTVSLKKRDDQYWLTVSSIVNRESGPPFTILLEGWHFVAVAIRDGMVTVSIDHSSWLLPLPRV